MDIAFLEDIDFSLVLVVLVLVSGLIYLIDVVFLAKERAAAVLETASATGGSKKAGTMKALEGVSLQEPIIVEYAKSSVDMGNRPAYTCGFICSNPCSASTSGVLARVKVSPTGAP